MLYIHSVYRHQLSKSTLHHFQSVREEEETAATEKAEVEMEEEKNRLTIELENEQRVTLG